MLICKVVLNIWLVTLPGNGFPFESDSYIKIMNPESKKKTTPHLTVTKTARAAFIHRLNMPQKLSRAVSGSNIHLTEEEQHAI